MQTCRPAKCIEAIRVAKLDPCTLAPVPGLLNGYAIGCIIDPNWTPEIEEGEESIVKDNCGNICLRDDRCDLTKRWNLEFKIKDPDKEFLSLIEGNPLIVDGGGNSIGVRQLSYGACSPWLFVELFEKTDSCDAGGDAVYLRHIFPAARLKWTGNEREGVFRILQIEGKTRDVLTDSIGSGPFHDIVPATAIVGASDTERIDYVWFEDDFVPTIQCGAIEVPDPVEILSVAQDEGTSELVITGTGFDANIWGLFLELNDAGGSVLQVGTGQVILVSDTEIRVSAAVIIGFAPADVTGILLRDEGNNDIPGGDWTGEVAIVDP